MPTENEIDRLAAMTNAMRPDWPTRSLRTHLAQHHATRPYRDLAVALAYVASDPNTKTPARLKEPGPWWKASAVEDATITYQTVKCPDHPDQRLGLCAPCADLAAPMPSEIRAAARAARRTAPKPTQPTRQPDPESVALARARADQEQP